MLHSRRKPKLSRKIRIGTRGSPLALWQTRHVIGILKKSHPSINCEVVIIKTSGDSFSNLKKRSQKSQVAGHKYAGKGLFVKEIEESLLSGAIDIAVHSMKDVPAEIPKKLQLTAFLKREDPFDVFISEKYSSLKDMPVGSTVGTSSPRRAAQVLSERPDLIILPLRGNVGTRLGKINEGYCDATILAVAGLERLKRLKRLKRLERLKRFVSSAGQGIICIESRAGDNEQNAILKKLLNHPKSEREALAERTFLQTVVGDCHTPIAARAIFKGGKISLTGFVSSPSGKTTMLKKGSSKDPISLGANLASSFIKAGARKIMNSREKREIMFTGLKGTMHSLKNIYKTNGIKVVELPLIEIKPPSDGYRSLDRAIANIQSYDWVVFTSRNAVNPFLNCLNRWNGWNRWNAVPAGRQGWNGSKVAAVGPSTADALRSKGVRVNLISKAHSSEGLAEAIKKFKMRGKRVLFPRAKEGRDELARALRKQGARVDVVEAYRTVPKKINTRKVPNVVVFTSPSTVDAYIKNFGKRKVFAVCIGETTKRHAMRKRIIQVLS